jgi:hypothetical protein
MEARKVMRYLSKALVVAVGLFSIGVLSSSVSANNLLEGSFKLERPIQWKSTVLPAGDYTFKMTRTQTDTNMLAVRGQKKSMDILIFAQSACEKCKSGELQLDVQGGTRVVTSLELPGFHVDFNSRQSPAQREQQMTKAHAASEQVAVHVDSN